MNWGTKTHTGWGGNLMDCLVMNKAVHVHGNGHDYTVHRMEWVGVCVPGAMCNAYSSMHDLSCVLPTKYGSSRQNKVTKIEEASCLEVGDKHKGTTSVHVLNIP